MEFNQQELEYILTCLNSHYSEMDWDLSSQEHKNYIMELNSQIAIKIDEQLQLHRRAF